MAELGFGAKKKPMAQQRQQPGARTAGAGSNASASRSPATGLTDELSDAALMAELD